MTARIVAALVAKDLKLFFRDKFFAVVTVLGLVAYTTIYFIMPDSLDETLDVGVYASELPPIFEEELGKEGVVIHRAESEEALKQAIDEGDYNVGIALSPGIAKTLQAGEKGRLTVYFGTDFPEELKESYTILLSELVALMGGRELHLTGTSEILGPDMSGHQIPLRKRMLPLFAVFIILTETLGLAALIASELEVGTVHALLVSPMNVNGFFLAKGITGVTLAFTESALLLTVTGALGTKPSLILVALFLGALLVTSVAFLVASVAKDFMSVIAWGFLAMITLSLPSLTVILPGMVSSWIKVIPTYYLVDTVHRASNLALGWEDLWTNLVALVIFDAALIALGTAALKRRLQWT